jgi:hypothetical protein
MKLSYLLAVTLFLPLTIQAQQHRISPVYTADIDRFWTAYDSTRTTPDTIKQVQFIQKLYVDKGTEGLHAFMKARNYDAKLWVQLINEYPRFWKSIRNNTLVIKSQAKAIEASIDRFKLLYPEMRPAKMYFTVGGLRSGGTTTDDMVLIGTEIATADLYTDATELSDWLKDVFKAQDATNLVALNVHEYVHTQQKPGDNKVLAQSIKEGAADFIADLITGKVNTSSYMIYGRQHEAELKELFKVDMFSTALSKWLYNGTNVEHADLGYFMGYSICKAFYQKSSNKKQAVKEIIELNHPDEQAVESFLKKSGYYLEPLRKDSLLKQFEVRIPYVLHLSPDVNLHTDVSKALTDLTIIFSEPMGEGRSISIGKGGKAHFPFTGIIGWSEDRRSFTLKVALTAGQSYDFVITGDGFKSIAGYPLKEYKASFTAQKD